MIISKSYINNLINYSSKNNPKNKKNHFKIKIKN